MDHSGKLSIMQYLLHHSTNMTVQGEYRGSLEQASRSLRFKMFSSYGDEIRSLTLKIETFLNKEWTEGLKQIYFTDFFQVVN